MYIRLVKSWEISWHSVKPCSALQFKVSNDKTVLKPNKNREASIVNDRSSHYHQFTPTQRLAERCRQYQITLLYLCIRCLLTAFLCFCRISNQIYSTVHRIGFLYFCFCFFPVKYLHTCKKVDLPPHKIGLKLGYLTPEICSRLVFFHLFYGMKHR